MMRNVAHHGTSHNTQDELEAYMNAVQQEVAENKPTNRARPGLEVDEQGNVADYMEASSCRILVTGFGAQAAGMARILS